MHKAFTLIVLIMSLSSCGIQMPNWGLANNNSDLQYTVDQNAAANSVVEAQKSVERLPVKVVEIPTSGVGFSAVSIQPGKTQSKRIMAIKTRLDALRQLTEQIRHQLTGFTKIAEAIVQSTHYSRYQV